MNLCQKCGKSVSPHDRVGLRLKGKPLRKVVYYCWECAGAALKNGEAFRLHIATVKRMSPDLRARLGIPAKTN